MDATPLVQMVTAVAAFGSAFIAWLGKRHAKEGKEVSKTIEDAVNHRHRHDGQPRLYDLAIENHRRVQVLEEGQERHDAFHEEVMLRMDANTEAHHKIGGRLDDIEGELKRHVMWEETVKYPEVNSERDLDGSEG